MREQHLDRQSFQKVVKAAKKSFSEFELNGESKISQLEAIEEGYTLDDFRRMEGDERIPYLAGLVF